MDGITEADMMALINGPLLNPGLDPFSSMPLDNQPMPAYAPPYTSSYAAPPMSQDMGARMAATGPPSTSLTALQSAAGQRDRESLGQDGTAAAQQNSGVGAGGSTDFTKRRNWPAKVIEEMKDLLQVLDGHGRIKYVSPSVTSLVGYRLDEMVNRHLKDLIHPDDSGLFISEMNEAIAAGASMRIFYRLKKKDGLYAIFEAVGHAHVAAPQYAPNPTNRSPFCQAVFLISRPYPTKNAGLLDSFLEHKVENERLRRRIANLRLEEETDEADAQRQLKQRRDNRSDPSQSEGRRTGSMSIATGTGTSLGFGTSSIADGSMAPPDLPSENSSGALTRENLEGAVAGAPQDSLRDKMARFEQGTPIETIEMLTGRRYVDGDRRKNGSGQASPKLITGDAGITIPIGREARSGEKKRRQKVVEEYVCTDCGMFIPPFFSSLFTRFPPPQSST